MRSALVFVLLATLVMGCSEDPPPPKTELASQKADYPPREVIPDDFSGRLSDLRDDTAGLGAGWKVENKTLIVDDFDDLSNLDSTRRQLAEGLKRLMQPKGIKACADFSYGKDGSPTHLITFRIYVFRSQAACLEYWTKFDSPEAEQEIKEVQGWGEEAVDHNSLRKRTVRFSNVVLTAEQLHDSKDYLRVLRYYLKRVGGGDPE